MEFDDIISVLAFCVAVIGLIFTAWQIRRSDTTQRGIFFKELYEPFFLDRQILYAFRLIEEEGLGFMPQDLGAENEKDAEKRQKAVERLLAQFEIICSLLDRGLLTREDMIHFDYNIQRVCRVHDFFEYIEFLEEWRKEKRLDQGPYSSFIKYVLDNRNRLVPTPRSGEA